MLHKSYIQGVGTTTMLVAGALHSALKFKDLTLLITMEADRIKNELISLHGDEALSGLEVVPMDMASVCLTWMVDNRRQPTHVYIDKMSKSHDFQINSLTAKLDQLSSDTGLPIFITYTS